MRLIPISLNAAALGHATRTSAAVVGVLTLGLAACGSDGATSSVGEPTSTVGEAPADGVVAADEQTSETTTGNVDEIPTIVVTTNVLGDVVGEVVGEAADVVTIMPVDADPHDFQASAQEIDELMQADAFIVNGGSYEEGLLAVIESAIDDGVPTFEALSAVSTIEYEDSHHDDDEHDDEEHDDEEHDDDEHDHSGEDPHFFTDPMRMAAAVDGIVDFLQDTVEFADPAVVEASADSYLAALTALDADVAEMVSEIPEDARVLLTNHQVFGYFADRYGFEVIGAVIPSGNTLDTASGGELDELTELISTEGVRAIFSDTSASDDLIQTVADEVGDIEVIALYTESLGAPGSDGGTYLDMVRTNSERIVDGLS